MKCPKPASRRRPRRWYAAALLALTPALMGGCPEFRNGLVNIANDATQSVVLGDQDRDAAWETAVRGALGATIDLLFDQLRNDNVR